MVPRPTHANNIDTKWIFKNKTDEHGVVTRNKAQLVVQGYAQIEVIDFGETFASVACLEAICLLLSFSCIRQIKHFQMDVKSAFLNNFLLRKYVAQPKGFINLVHPDYVHKLQKALYNLKQVPSAWNQCLSEFLSQ